MLGEAQWQAEGKFFTGGISAYFWSRHIDSDVEFWFASRTPHVLLGPRLTH
jgi:hypothetical protein